MKDYESFHPFFPTPEDRRGKIELFVLLVLPIEKTSGVLATNG